MKRIYLQLIPGDGIGVDVTREGKRVLEKAAEIHGGIKFIYEEHEWSCKYYMENKKMMPENGLEILSECDAILLGAIGFPDVPDHISLQELLLPIRQHFNQYVNFRPVQFMQGFNTPLGMEHPEEINYVIIRENSEGEYCGKGSFQTKGTEKIKAIQESHFSREGCGRIIRYAFEYARQHGLKSVTSATKSNALQYSMVFWDSIFNLIKQEYPGIATKSVHIDALSAQLVLNPEKLDVIVASNLFGDILSDLGSATLGSIGIAPSANINPEKKYPSMFEPVHGSAPDIAGKGSANPTGMIWTIILLLEHLELKNLAENLMNALKHVYQQGVFLTPDMGGSGSTTEVTNAILDKFGI